MYSSLFDRPIFRDAFSSFLKKDAETPAATDTPERKTQTGANAQAEVYTANSEELARRISVVFACARIISESIAKLPVLLERWNRTLKCYVTMEDTIRWRTVRALTIQANERQTAFELWQGAVLDVFFKGNSYVTWTEDEHGYPDAFYLLGCLDSTCHFDARSNTYLVKGGTYCPVNGTLTADRMLHFKGHATDHGIQGRPIMYFATDNLSIARTATANTLDSFAKKGVGKFILHNTDEDPTSFAPEMTDDQMQDIASDIQAQMNANNDIIIKRGPGKLESMQMTQEQMQSLGKIDINTRDLCRYFGVPLSKVFEKGDHNYKSEEAANMALYNEALQPIIEKIDQELNAKLVPNTKETWNAYRFRHNTNPLFLLDKTAEAEYWNKRQQNGTATIAEAREAMNMPYIENTDIVLVSANLKTPEMLASEGTPTTEPTPNNNNNE